MTTEADSENRFKCLGVFLQLRRSELPEVLSVEKLTQQEMAERAGIGVGWYRVIEQGRAKNVSLHVLDKLAEACLLKPIERKLFLYSYADPFIAEVVSILPSSLLRR